MPSILNISLMSFSRCFVGGVLRRNNAICICFSKELSLIRRSLEKGVEWSVKVYRDRTNVERRHPTFYESVSGLRVQFARRVCRNFSALVARSSCAVGAIPVGVRETPRYLTWSSQEEERVRECWEVFIEENVALADIPLHANGTYPRGADRKNSF